MKKERILCLLGYDPELLRELRARDRQSLRGSAVAWLVACFVLSLAAAHAFWLVLPLPWVPVVGGLGLMILTVNLLRVVVAGGGSELGGSPSQGKARCRKYRPSLVPALVFAVLGGLLSQPAQLPFWPELEDEVEEHRQTLILQHNDASEALGTDPRYYREELESAGFPIFRLKLIWREPHKALRWTAVIFLIVLLPAFWSQFVSLQSRRAYEWQRFRRAYRHRKELGAVERERVSRLLGQWPTYAPAMGRDGGAQHV